jgi:site-specific DNA-methyltransferase (adenine-specific)
MYTDFYPSSIQSFPNHNGGNVHPTQKPVALMEYLIRTYTNEGELVLDNCMGSGTTGVACVNTKRRFIGIEKLPEYYDIATERIYNAAFGVTT